MSNQKIQISKISIVQLKQLKRVKMMEHYLFLQLIQINSHIILNTWQDINLKSKLIFNQKRRWKRSSLKVNQKLMSMDSSYLIWSKTYKRWLKIIQMLMIFSSQISKTKSNELNVNLTLKRKTYENWMINLFKHLMNEATYSNHGKITSRNLQKSNLTFSIFVTKIKYMKLKNLILSILKSKKK